MSSHPADFVDGDVQGSKRVHEPPITPKPPSPLKPKSTEPVYVYVVGSADSDETIIGTHREMPAAIEQAKQGHPIEVYRRVSVLRVEEIG